MLSSSNGSTLMSSGPIAHWRQFDDTPQYLQCHLEGVGALSRVFASKLGLPLSGELIGLLHDLGKYSKEFQDYICSALGLIDGDADDYVDANERRGKVDHSSAGAQFVWHAVEAKGALERGLAQILALCIASHHSGLIDCLDPDGEDTFSKRMRKAREKTHLDEVINAADKPILERAEAILKDPELISSLQARLARIATAQAGHGIIMQQQFGLLVRFLFSCLIDADRLDTATFEKPRANRNRMHGRYEDWPILAGRLEKYLATLVSRQPIDGLRADISRHCLDAAERQRGSIYKLSVPTGGGKTLASLRFALHHASHHKMDRVIYVIPFTSIIDQNADVVRCILEPSNMPESHGRIVLEHHGNLTPEEQSWREKMLTENWDAPVIYTTTVQLLEALFGAGTRGARRMHQLANAVIVFDEIQTLPINCVHIFNNAIKFLTEQCGSTVVLCTATQPLLDIVDQEKGALRIPDGNELMRDVKGLFEQLKRVELIYDRKPGGWTNDEIATLAKEAAARAGSCLVIVNTKTSAQNLYQLCKLEASTPVFHLSTSMCPAHRKRILRVIRHRLKWEKATLCISTQLIEAGVDVDFGGVIRFVAGLDSIAQAAGRCNRNGKRETGVVRVVNPKDENLGKLEAISIGRDKTERVLADYAADPGKYGNDRLGPELMAWYYKNYFFDRADQMDYPVSADAVGRADTLLNMLSGNLNAYTDFNKRQPNHPQFLLYQSFMTAAKAFKAIDAPTRGVIVPYAKGGREIVNDLCAAFEVEKQYDLLKRAQQYTVNVFPHVLSKLEKAGAIHPIQAGTQIFHLDPRYYSPEFGLLTEPSGKMEPLYCD
jgi:CRISPR-associated endonuclease/helicase Cas3